jgi:hypothetical protein
MNRLPRIYRLLTREFEQSRHVVWVDEEGRVVTDVTFFVLLLLDAAERDDNRGFDHVGETRAGSIRAPIVG